MIECKFKNMTDPIQIGIAIETMTVNGSTQPNLRNVSHVVAIVIKNQEKNADSLLLPTFHAWYRVERKELCITNVRRGGIEPGQKYLAKLLGELLAEAPLQMDSILFEVVDNEKAFSALLPIFRSAPDNVNLVDEFISVEKLLQLPLTNSLIAVGFRKLEIIPLSGRGGSIFGLRGSPSDQLTLSRLSMQ